MTTLTPALSQGEGALFLAVGTAALFPPYFLLKLVPCNGKRYDFFTLLAAGSRCPYGTTRTPDPPQGEGEFS